MSLALAVRFRVWYSIQKIVLPPTWKYHNLIITWCHCALLEHWHLGFPLENLYLRIFLFAISPLRHNFSYSTSPKNVLGLKLIEWRLEFASTCKLSILVSFFNSFGLSCTIVQKKYFSRTMIHSCFQEQCYRSPTRPTFPVGGLSHIRFPFRWGLWILPTEARFQLSKARSSSTTPKKKGYVDVHSCYRGPNTFGWRVSCFQIILAYTLLYYHYSLFLSDHLTIIWALCGPSRIKLGGRKVLPTI